VTTSRTADRSVDPFAPIHGARALLARDLAGLTQEQWRSPSLCAGLSVRDVVAHLTAGASLSFPRWLAMLARARFDADAMVARQVAEHLGADPADTLARFRAVVTSTTVPSRRHLDAWLGEVLVHGEDVRRPLGLAGPDEVAAWERVARFYVARDFTVPSRTLARGLRLEATDGGWRHGDGPLVRGTTRALVMALAGRRAYLDELDGDGVAVLASR
jgi:uncharacterized protein (TIGR03083 family)